ncbi:MULTISPECIES: TetR/AcrR family transcriptional regulator [unclassified Mesorhizobium]|uniref:TetR/AcrR family transcriptional regulator n=1 Tax=unclassified Mesorhizobium TaxID=325217 RepID=UPI0024164C75|nr:MULTISPECIES: TetR/AcrR family transcriptional regulator [unclassified Mesorhizobium]WFP65606.1 TetR/AcrR family transcriptional regulator [Mesorhizobium sp. WSM4904]WFP78870.1 TetR/AcrR family transcriptional regulator [Mesorhizobium sp. WSM4906]
MRDISETPGYSQGAFYWNFADKDSLLVELVDGQLVQLAESFDALIRETEPCSLDETLLALVRWLNEQHADQRLSHLMLEFQMYANRSQNFGASFRKRHAGHLSTFADGFAVLFARYGKVPPLSPMHMAIGFIALWNGFSALSPQDYGVAPGDVYLPFLRALFADAAEEA